MPMAAGLRSEFRSGRDELHLVCSHDLLIEIKLGFSRQVAMIAGPHNFAFYYARPGIRSGNKISADRALYLLLRCHKGAGENRLPAHEKDSFNVHAKLIVHNPMFLSISSRLASCALKPSICLWRIMKSLTCVSAL